MIVKNEEKFLPECLESVKSIVDEIILVDTGSTDNTIEIAKKYNAKIYHFEWINDFSAARNFSLSKATGEWILYLDADERLSEKSKIILPNLLNTKGIYAYWCKVRSIQSNTLGTMEYPRLFKNSKNIKFSGTVHEQITPSLIENNYELLPSEIEIIHLGYDISQNDLKIKANRNLQLLIKDFKIKKTSLVAFHIGQSLIELGRNEESINYFIYSYEDKKFDVFQRAHACRYIAAFYLEIKEYDKLIIYLNKGLQLNDSQPLLNIIASEYNVEIGNYEKAEYYIKKAFLSSKNLIENGFNYFEIIPSLENILMKSIQISVMINSKILFDYFNNYSEQFITSVNFKKIVMFFNILYNEHELTSEDIPENIHTYFNFSSVLQIIEKYDLQLQIQYGKILIQKYSEQIELYKNIILLLVKSSLYEEALIYFKKALNMKTDDAELLLLSIDIYTSLNKFSELKNILNKYKNIFKSDSILSEKIDLIIQKIP